MPALATETLRLGSEMVVVGGDRALIRSANFAKKGLTGRTEMSVLLDEQDTIDELAEWFETLWSIYDPLEADRVEASYVTPQSVLYSPFDYDCPLSEQTRFSDVRSLLFGNVWIEGWPRHSRLTIYP